MKAWLPGGMRTALAVLLFALNSAGAADQNPETTIDLNPQDPSLLLRPAKEIQVEKTGSGGLRITYENKDEETYRRIVLEKTFSPPVPATAIGFDVVLAAQESMEITAKDAAGVVGKTIVNGASGGSTVVAIDQLRTPGGDRVGDSLQKITLSIPMLAQPDRTTIEVQRWYLQR